MANSQNIKWNEFDKRIELAFEAFGDVQSIEKVPNAGEIILKGGEEWQVMFNGLRMKRSGYYGDWMSELIQKLQGHHEPQEERVFHEIINHLKNPESMIELGAYWGWYSLWFKSRFPHAKVIVSEPDPSNLAIAAENAKENNLEIHAELGAVAPSHMIDCNGKTKVDNDFFSVPALTVEKLMEQYKIENLTILHSDIQGAEFTMLEDAKSLLEARRIDYLLISTHWDSMHEKCMSLLESCGYLIIASHTLDESHSFDGLIAAASPTISPPSVSISHRNSARV